MTKRDFFILWIKIFGLLSFVTSLFSAIPGNIALALMDFDRLSMFWISAAVAVVVGLFVILIFKADKVVQLLKLDKGFDEDRMDFGNLSGTDIMKIGTFIIGGLMILDNIPNFLSHTLFAFKEDIAGEAYDSKANFSWAVSAINIFLGYILVSNYAFVARLMKTPNKPNES